MDGWKIVICTAIGCAVGGIYGLIMSLRNKAKQKNQTNNQETPSKPKRFNPIPLLLMVIIAAASFITINAFSNAAPKEKIFSKSGLTIALTDEFYEKERVSYTAVFESENIAVFATKEETSSNKNKILSLEEYTELVIDTNKLDATVEETEGLIAFTFNNNGNGKDYRIFASVYKSNDAYWLVQFSCENTKYESFKAKIIQYAKSVNVIEKSGNP